MDHRQKLYVIYLLILKLKEIFKYICKEIIMLLLYNYCRGVFTNQQFHSLTHLITYQNIISKYFKHLISCKVNSFTVFTTISFFFKKGAKCQQARTLVTSLILFRYAVSLSVICIYGCFCPSLSLSLSFIIQTWVIPPPP